MVRIISYIYICNIPPRQSSVQYNMPSNFGKNVNVHVEYVGMIELIKDIKSEFGEKNMEFWNGDISCVPRWWAPWSKADKVIAGVAQRAQALRRLVMDVNSRKAPQVQHIFGGKSLTLKKKGSSFWRGTTTDGRKLVN